MIILHHLNYSRSSRVIWLLEELGLEYRLVRYERDATMRAPAALALVHPLGKAPVIQDGNLTIAESASILSYIDAKHGGGRLTPPLGSDAATVHDEWLQYAESSAAFPILLTLIGGMTGGLPERLGGFASQGVAKTLDYIASALGRTPYLAGGTMMLADIQMSYLLIIAEHAGLLADQPVVAAYLDRLRARPAFIRALEIGGPMAPPR